MIPINVDKNYSLPSLAKLAKDKLLVTSLFYTIQGEGPYTGYPAVFVRLAGCNFGSKSKVCSWCDTEFQATKAMKFDIPTLVEELKGYIPADVTPMLVVTGGEPTLQPLALELIEQVKRAKLFSFVQIETNGTQSDFFVQATQRKVQMHVVVSPKATDQGQWVVPSKECLEYTKNTLGRHCLKLVVSADATSGHSTLPEGMFGAKLPVYISPMTVYAKAYKGEVSSIWEKDLINKKKTQANYAYATQLCMEHGYQLSLQTHLFTALP